MCICKMITYLKKKRRAELGVNRLSTCTSSSSRDSISNELNQAWLAFSFEPMEPSLSQPWIKQFSTPNVAAKFGN